MGQCNDFHFILRSTKSICGIHNSFLSKRGTNRLKRAKNSFFFGPKIPVLAELGAGPPPPL